MISIDRTKIFEKTLVAALADKMKIHLSESRSEGVGVKSFPAVAIFSMKNKSMTATCRILKLDGKETLIIKSGHHLRRLLAVDDLSLFSLWLPGSNNYIPVIELMGSQNRVRVVMAARDKALYVMGGNFVIEIGLCCYWCSH